MKFQCLSPIRIGNQTFLKEGRVYDGVFLRDTKKQGKIVIYDDDKRRWVTFDPMLAKEKAAAHEQSLRQVE